MERNLLCLVSKISKHEVTLNVGIDCTVFAFTKVDSMSEKLLIKQVDKCLFTVDNHSLLESFHSFLQY